MELRHTLWLLLLCLQCFNGVGWVTGRHLAHKNQPPNPQRFSSSARTKNTHREPAKPGSPGKWLSTQVVVIVVVTAS